MISPKNLYFSALAGCLGLLLALPASAEDGPPAPDYAIGLASYAFPDSQRDADYGAGGHLRYGFPLSDRMAIEGGVFAIDIKRESDSDLDDFYYGLGADLFYGLRENALLENKLTPFVLGGLGIFHDDVKTERDTGAYLNLGLGLLLPTGTERLRLRLEGRYILALADHAPARTDPAISGSSFNEAQLNLGIQLALGTVVVNQAAVVDLDNDGVSDDRDKCPGTPAGVPVDINGCARDSDGDGVADYLDECPGTPPGTPVNAKGCERDDDNDGVGNSKDQCPNTPAGDEVDLRGCSIIKSCEGDCDQDGVINAIDQCPGTLPGLEVDPVGCVVKQQSLVLEGVQFEFDQAWLKPESAPILDRVAETMRGQPGMVVLIAGHTDSMGSDEYNINLSKGRAASVRRYLIEQGIDENRLRSQGFGERLPIASNDTDAGRALNRRVVFEVLQIGPGEIQPEVTP